MTKKMEMAKGALKKEGIVCAVAVSDGSILVSGDKGIRPLLYWLENKSDVLKGSCAADRVVGKAAALLMIYGGVKEVYAELISEPASECLQAFGIPFQYDKIVPRIMNRDRTGLCPMESLCIDVTSPEEGYQKLLEKWKQMQNSGGGLPEQALSKERLLK